MRKDSPALASELCRRYTSSHRERRSVAQGMNAGSLKARVRRWRHGILHLLAMRLRTKMLILLCSPGREFVGIFIGSIQRSRPLGYAPSPFRLECREGALKSAVQNKKPLWSFHSLRSRLRVLPRVHRLFCRFQHNHPHPLCGTLRICAICF